MALNQLLVVTAGCRLLKFDAHSGQLLSEVDNNDGEDGFMIPRKSLLIVTDGCRLLKLDVT